MGYTCAIHWLLIHTTGAAHPSDKTRIVRNTESVAMHSEVAACASASSQPASRHRISLARHHRHRPAIRLSRHPLLRRHQQPFCTCNDDVFHQAGNRGTSTLDKTDWSTYTPSRPLHHPCTVNPYIPCIGAPETNPIGYTYSKQR
jgi:hypothetical protein